MGNVIAEVQKEHAEIKADAAASNSVVALRATVEALSDLVGRIVDHLELDKTKRKE